MARRQTSAPCAACGVVTSGTKLSRVVVEARTVLLCREHAAVVAANMPRTFEELRRLFVEPPSAERSLARRSLVERRAVEDRRAFPPRPEGRRMSNGRRGTDRAA